VNNFYRGGASPDTIAADTTEGRDAIQKGLDKLERWALVNLIKFNKQSARFCTWVRVMPGMYTD